MLDLFVQTLELVHLGDLLRPAHAQALNGIGLGDHVKVDMSDLLVRQLSVVLKHIVILGSCRAY